MERVTFSDTLIDVDIPDGGEPIFFAETFSGEEPRTLVLALVRLSDGSLCVNWTLGMKIDDTVSLLTEVAESLGSNVEDLPLLELTKREEVAGAYRNACESGSVVVEGKSVSSFLDGSAFGLFSQLSDFWGVDGNSYYFYFPGKNVIELWCGWPRKLKKVAKQFNRIIDAIGLDRDQYGVRVTW